MEEWGLLAEGAHPEKLLGVLLGQRKNNSHGRG